MLINNNADVDDFVYKNGDTHLSRALKQYKYWTLDRVIILIDLINSDGDIPNSDKSDGRIIRYAENLRKNGEISQALVDVLKTLKRCGQCPICLELLALKKPLVFSKCGHVICNPCYIKYVEHEVGVYDNYVDDFIGEEDFKDKKSVECPLCMTAFGTISCKYEKNNDGEIEYNSIKVVYDEVVDGYRTVSVFNPNHYKADYTEKDARTKKGDPKVLTLELLPQLGGKKGKMKRKGAK